MSAVSDEIARAAALHFARGFALFLDAQSAPQPLGVYLIGSLAHGESSRRYSDIDMALVTERGLSQSALDAMRTEARAALDFAFAATDKIFRVSSRVGIFCRRRNGV